MAAEAECAFATRCGCTRAVRGQGDLAGTVFGLLSETDAPALERGIACERLQVPRGEEGLAELVVLPLDAALPGLAGWSPRGHGGAVR